MNPDQIRTRGLVHLIAGALLAVLVVLIGSVVPAVPSPAATVTALFMCLCLAAAGGLSLWIFDAESATRLRRWFVVLEGVVLTVVWPLVWSISQLNVGPGDFDVLGAVALAVPVLLAFVLTNFHALTVHRFVVAANGPLVTGGGEGVPAQRMRSLGAVMVVVGVMAACGQQFAIAALPVSAARAGYMVMLAVLVALCPVVLGVLLTRVRNIGSVNAKVFAVAFGFGVFSNSLVDPALATGTALGVVLAGLVLVSQVLVAIGLLTARGYIGVWQKV